MYTYSIFMYMLGTSRQTTGGTPKLSHCLRCELSGEGKLAESRCRKAACGRVSAVAALAMGDLDEARGPAGDIRFRRELD
jgi:hypothetical protein